MEETINNLVSIIMPCYNCEKYLSESIESILNQSYTSWELLAINDNSKDNTREILSVYASKDSRIRVICNDYNLGVAESRNAGIRESKGRYISFCDSDDLWDESKLSKQLLYIKKYPIVCSNYFIINEKSEILKYVIGPEIFEYKQMLRLNLIPNSSALIDKTSITSSIIQKKVGHEDYLMWLKLLRPKVKVYRIQEPLLHYRKHSNSLSSNKWKAMRWTWNIYYTELNLSLTASIYFFLHYVFQNLKKQFIK